MPHLWLVSKIPPKTWDDCRSTPHRKSRTHNYDSLVELLIELTLERANDAHMEEYLRIHLGRNTSQANDKWGGRENHESSKGHDGSKGTSNGAVRAMQGVLNPDEAKPPPPPLSSIVDL